MTQSWCVYVIHSKKTGVLYTGIAIFPRERLKKHNQGTGAKFTRGRGPWELVGFLIYASKGTALHIERRVKKLTSDQKWDWARGLGKRYEWDRDS